VMGMVLDSPFNFKTVKRIANLTGVTNIMHKSSRHMHDALRTQKEIADVIIAVCVIRCYDVQLKDEFVRKHRHDT